MWYGWYVLTQLLLDFSVFLYFKSTVDIAGLKILSSKKPNECSSTLYPRVIRSKTYHSYVKPQIIPNTTLWCSCKIHSDILAWVQEGSKMSQVLGIFGLLDFTMLWPILTMCEVWNLWTVSLFNFPGFFLQAVVNCRYWISKYKAQLYFPRTSRTKWHRCVSSLYPSKRFMHTVPKRQL
jgi:hypothetical protein